MLKPGYTLLTNYYSVSQEKATSSTPTYKHIHCFQVTSCWPHRYINTAVFVCSHVEGFNMLSMHQIPVWPQFVLYIQ